MIGPTVGCCQSIEYLYGEGNVRRNFVFVLVVNGVHTGLEFRCKVIDILAEKRPRKMFDTLHLLQRIGVDELPIFVINAVIADKRHFVGEVFPVHIDGEIGDEGMTVVVVRKVEGGIIGGGGFKAYQQGFRFCGVEKLVIDIDDGVVALPDDT